MSVKAYLGADVFDGVTLHSGAALLIDGDVVRGVVALPDIPTDASRIDLQGGVLLSGFVDLQANGGGGVMFNDAPTLDTLRRMADAHWATGTRAVLPTLITDTPDTVQAAINAVEAAIAENVQGIIGLHLEGPHLSVAKKGAHEADLIRPMTGADEALLCDAAGRLPNLLVTVAPESVSPEQIARLTQAGVIISLGHSACTATEAQAAFAAGASCVTHLFNAMSGLGSREPGLVGASLTTHAVKAGLIADGIHVHPDSIRIACAAKADDTVFLVTDAMAPLGSAISEFTLNERRVLRRDGRLSLDDGTLAGADLTMAQAVLVMVEKVGVSLEQALRMATSVPAGVLRAQNGCGHLRAGTRWRGVHLAEDFSVTDPLAR